MCKGIISKILLFIITFTLWIAGILLIVFGSIGLADPRTMVDILTITPGMESIVDIIDVYYLLEGVSIFMIVLGSLLFIFGWIGCHGASKSHKISLILFFVALIFAILTEVALIIYAAVYPTTVTDYIQTEMKTSLNGYESETIEPNGTIIFSTDATFNAWQNLQSKTHCCGAGTDGTNGYTDYKNYQFSYTYNSTTYNSAEVPPTCCQTGLQTGDPLSNADQINNINGCLSTPIDGNSYWTQSCWKGVEDMIYQYNYISIITCAVLIAAELLAVLLTFRLWHVRD